MIWKGTTIHSITAKIIPTNFPVVLWFPLLFWVLFQAYWIVLYVNAYVDYEEYVLGVQVNYATDSAISEMLEYSTPLLNVVMSSICM